MSSCKRESCRSPLVATVKGEGRGWSTKQQSAGCQDDGSQPPSRLSASGAVRKGSVEEMRRVDRPLVAGGGIAHKLLPPFRVSSLAIFIHVYVLDWEKEP